MGDRLQGKKVLVTAAAQGIGLASARACLAEGAEVIATDVNLEKLEREFSGRDGDHCLVKKLDVLDRVAISNCAKAVGPVDVLMNIAGFVHHGTILESSEEDWDFAINLNVRSMVRMIRAFLPGMIENGGATIVNISSVASSLKGFPLRCVYGTTKAAVLGLTRSVAIDFIKQGVRCNAICPGTVESPSLDGRIEALGKEMGGLEKAREWFVSRQPMGRLGKADEVATMAVYLASDDSAFTTGTAMIIDGGVCL
ncbi:MAG: SDR family oxidoreductase [Methyloligellaceae bacterium]